MDETIKHLLQDFRSGWESFVRATVLINEKNFNLLLSVLRRKLATSIEFLYGYTDFAAVRIDLSDIKIRLSQNSLVCFIRIDKKKDATASEAFRLFTTSHYSYGPPGYSSIAIVHGDTEELKKRCKNALQDSVILDRNQLEEVIAADSWSDTLAQVIRSEKTPDILSPYDEVGVCSPELFLGRENEIAKLTSHAKGHGYALVGCRRVGKSSLLLRLKRHYDQIGEPTFYIDCQSCYSKETFYEEIVKRTRPKDLKNIKQWNLKGYLIRLAGMCNKSVNLFLDEIDWVVAADKKSNYQFIIRELLSASMTGNKSVRLWMVGFKDLFKAATNREGPIFGKTRTVELGPLSIEETHQLVSTPMTHMGFSFEDENAVVQKIYKEAAGHPAFIQLYCRLLVDELVNENEKRIKLKHLDAVHGGYEFQDYVMNTFVFNTSELEKIIVLSVLDRNYFTQQEVFELLKEKYKIKLNYKSLYRELQDLRLGGIFRQKEGIFTFQYPVMSKIINDFGNPRYIENENIEKAQETTRQLNEKS